MSDTRVPVPPGFAELSKAQQIEYLQDLWDRISELPAEIPVPESHLDLAEARLRIHREDPGKAASAFEVLDRLKKKVK